MPYFTDFESFNARVGDIRGLVNENLLSSISISNNEKYDLLKMKENAEKNVRGLLNTLGYDGNDIEGSMAKLNARI